MRVALYARVSTTRQAQTQTIEQQLTRLRAHAQQQGWTVDEGRVYRDDGYSGASLSRPGLDRLRDRAGLAEIDIVLIAAPDRLARKYVHQVLLLEELQQRGCRVEFLDRPMSQDPHDQLLLQIRGAVAEYERTLIAERMRRGRLAKLRAGALLPWTTAPYGFRADPARPRDPAGVRHDPYEAAIVRQIFAWYLEPAASLHRVASRLRDAGVPTPSGQGIWRGESVRRILANPAYRGVACGNRFQSVPPRGRRSPLQPIGAGHSYVTRPTEEWVGVPVPPLVGAEEHTAVEEKLRQNQQRARRNNKSREYLLRGLLSCGQCRLSCTGYARGAYQYSACQGRVEPMRAARDERCPSRYLPAARLDDLVWQDLCALLSEPAHLAAAVARARGGQWLPQELQARRATLQQAAGQLDRQQRRLLDAYVAGVVELPELERVRGELAERQASLLTQQRQLDQGVAQQRDVALLAEGLEAFRQQVQARLAQATFAQRRALVELLIDRVIVNDGEIELRYVFPTSRDGPRRPFYQLRLDYRGAVVVVLSRRLAVSCP